MNKNISFFNTNKYIKIENILTKREADFFCSAIQYDAIQNPHIVDDGVGPSVQVNYANPISESILLNIQETVEKNIGMSLLPTYSYHRIYKPGSFLEKHTDRKSCEISATINLGYKYNTDNKNYRWNIWIDNKELITEPGDIVVYKGIDLPHWRKEFICGPDSWQIQVFLHWVDANGPYKDFIYDGRPGLGYDHTFRSLPTGCDSWFIE